MSFQLSDKELEDLFQNLSFDYSYLEYDPSTSPCPDPLFEISGGAVVAILSTVFVLSVLGNISVLLVLATMRNRRSCLDVCLLNLAASDLLSSLSLPIMALVVDSEWIFGDFLCKAVSVLLDLKEYTASLLLLFIHAGIVKPMNRVALCLMAWLVGTFLASPAALFHKVSMSSNETLVCHEHDHPAGLEALWLPFHMFRYAVGSAVPLLLLLIWAASRGRSATSSQNARKEKHVVFLVTLGFIMFRSPYNICAFIKTLIGAEILDKTCKIWQEIMTASNITMILSLSHCCINPVLYVSSWRKFREHFLKILTKQPKGHVTAVS